MKYKKIITNKNSLILLFILIAQLSFSQIETKSLSSLNLIGNVSSISDLTYTGIDNSENIMKGNVLDKDREGKLEIDNIKRNKTGFKFTFDKDGKQILKGSYIFMIKQNTNTLIIR